MSLLRMSFWVALLMLALALAPDFGMLGPAAERGRERAGIQDVFYIVSATASDLSEICERRPDVCKRMDRIWAQFCNRAVRLTGAAHDWLVGQDFARQPPVERTAPASEPANPPREDTGGKALHLAETPPENRQ